MAHEAKDIEKENEGEQEQVKKKFPMKLVLIIVVVLALAGAGAWMMFFSQPPEEVKEEQVSAEEQKVLPQISGPMKALDVFIVNLSDKRKNKYLKVKINLELVDESVSDMIDQLIPKVRDTILLLLSSKTYEEIRTLQGKYKLRDELVARINAVLDKGSVKNLYFTEFVVQ